MARDKLNHIFQTAKGEAVVAMTTFKSGVIICTTKRVLQVYKDDADKIEIAEVSCDSNG